MGAICGSVCSALHAGHTQGKDSCKPQPWAQLSKGWGTSWGRHYSKSGASAVRPGPPAPHANPSPSTCPPKHVPTPLCPASEEDAIALSIALSHCDSSALRSLEPAPAHPLMQSPAQWEALLYTGLYRRYSNALKRLETQTQAWALLPTALSCGVQLRQQGKYASASASAWLCSGCPAPFPPHPQQLACSL